MLLLKLRRAEVCAFAIHAGRNQIAFFTAAGRRTEAGGGSAWYAKRSESYFRWLGSLGNKNCSREGECVRSASGETCWCNARHSRH